MEDRGLSFGFGVLVGAIGGVIVGAVLSALVREREVEAEEPEEEPSAEASAQEVFDSAYLKLEESLRSEGKFEEFYEIYEDKLVEVLTDKSVSRKYTDAMSQLLISLTVAAAYLRGHNAAFKSKMEADLTIILIGNKLKGLYGDIRGAGSEEIALIDRLISILSSPPLEENKKNLA